MSCSFIIIIVATLFKKYKPEFVSLENEGEVLKSYKDSNLKSINHVLQLVVSINKLLLSHFMSIDCIRCALV